MGDLTADEQRAVDSLERLGRRWPQSLMLFSTGGERLCVIRVADQDALMADWDSNEDLVVAYIEGIPNDGGDP